MYNTDFINIVSGAMKDIVLVDLSWVLYRSYFVFPQDKFVAPNGHPNGHLFGLVKLLQTLDRMGFLVFLCEDGKCEFRKNLNEHYKEGRESKGFYKDYELIHNLISDLPNTYCLSNTTMEADDIIYSAAMLIPETEYGYIHSADNDLYQCLKRNNIKIAKSFSMNSIDFFDSNSEQYQKKYPVSPYLLPIYRALKGDSSDKLPPPVSRLPKKIIVRLCDFFNENSINANLDDFIIEKDSEKKWIDLLKENLDAFKLNYEMMKLNKIDFNVVHKDFSVKSADVAEEYGLYQFANYLGYSPKKVELF